jgi:DNA mismatch repair ATPase MutS
MFPSWLDILGRIDAYSSLGNYAFNNEEFAYPVRSDSGMIFSAGSLGHPLIDGNRRVCNDFTIENKGNICIITGANMAGKSTFLRTVAVNYILGMTGAPVCAASMVFTPVKLFTSMRTTDSLSGNESYFYAELKRLRNLKERIESGEPVFFILDEILKGTNSADKTMGSKMFIRKMILMKGTGMIATHDISIGDLENEYPENIFNMCFEIEIAGETINFDYKLNKGITRKMNAALLMKQMGILD